ncbi:hypothetical protein EOPP23_07690 [Endozoicomonas sp. OPT23]|nr:hypothetical protein [Endozoicomonas sp. OPT23]
MSTDYFTFNVDQKQCTMLIDFIAVVKETGAVSYRLNLISPHDKNEPFNIKTKDYIPSPELTAPSLTHSLNNILSKSLANDLRPSVLMSSTIPWPFSFDNYMSSLSKYPCIRMAVVLPEGMSKESLTEFKNQQKITVKAINYHFISKLLVSDTEVVWQNTLNPEYYKVISLAGENIDYSETVLLTLAGGSSLPIQEYIDGQTENSPIISCPKSELRTSVNGGEYCWPTDLSSEPLANSCTTEIIQDCDDLEGFLQGFRQSYDLQHSKSTHAGWLRAPQSRWVNLLQNMDSNHPAIIVRKPFSLEYGALNLLHRWSKVTEPETRLRDEYLYSRYKINAIQ